MHAQCAHKREGGRRERERWREGGEGRGGERGREGGERVRKKERRIERERDREKHARARKRNTKARKRENDKRFAYNYNVILPTCLDLILRTCT